LFSGPLYTIYKALSAVKLAGCLTQRQTKAVPVFWIATEDHDFPEVAKAEFIARDCKLAQVEVSAALHQEGQPVGRVVIDSSIDAVVGQLIELLPSSEFTPDVEAIVRDALTAEAHKGGIDVMAPGDVAAEMANATAMLAEPFTGRTAGAEKQFARPRSFRFERDAENRIVAAFEE